MKRRCAGFLALAALGWTFAAHPTAAADYGTAPYPNSPNGSQPYRVIQATLPVPSANTNGQSVLAGEYELRSQLILLTALAQDHRERAEAATKNAQTALAKWESDLAEELGHRGSNILAQLEGPDARKRALLGAGPVDATGELSSSEVDYLAKLQERLQALQQGLVAATEETKLYALQVATNRDALQSGDNSASLRLQGTGREINRLQAEQAELELKKTHFWALRQWFVTLLALGLQKRTRRFPRRLAPQAANNGVTGTKTLPWCRFASCCAKTRSNPCEGSGDLTEVR